MNKQERGLKLTNESDLFHEIISMNKYNRYTVGSSNVTKNEKILLYNYK